MKKLTSAILTAALAASMTACSSGTSSASAASAGSDKVINVAIVKQLDHASLDEIANAAGAEFDKLAEENGITINYTIYSGQNDQTVLQQIGTQAISDQVDVILPIATMAAQTMTVVAEDTKTPVVFAAISDPETAELTGIDYVTGTSDALNTEQIMQMIFAQNPEAKTVGLLYSKSEANSERPIAEAKAYLDAAGIKYIEATGNTKDEVIQAVSVLAASNVDVIFTPTDNVIMETELSIYETLIEAGIPHYAGADSFVRNGAFATCGVNYTELGAETARLAYTFVTEGAEATGYAGSYEVMPGGIITVNTETVEALGIKYDMFAEFGEIVEVVTTEE